MKILFTGMVLKPSWPGGEPAISRILERAFLEEGIEVFKCYLPRSTTQKWSLNPLTSQSLTNATAVNMYRRQIERVRPDIVMTWSDPDISSFWASVLEKVPVIAQAQILWPVCPSSCLFNEVDESPCQGPSKSCGLCLAKRAKAVGEVVRFPYVVCLPFTQLSMFRTINMRSKLKHASAIVSDSLFLKKMMAKSQFDVSKVHVIYNGVDLTGIKPSTSFSKPKTVLFLSNQRNKQKGFHHFIRLSKILKPQFPDVRFLWVGQTELQGNTFETKGYVWDKKELENIFSSCYLLLLPSLWPEPMSYSVIQAMAHGKPVVAYDVGANSESIIHGENGLLAEWGNVQQLASHVASLLNDENAAIKLGQNSRMRAEKMFTLDRMLDRYKVLLEEVMPGWK